MATGPPKHVPIDLDPNYALNALLSIYLWMALWRTPFHDGIPEGFRDGIEDLIRQGKLRILVSDMQHMAIRSGAIVPDRWLRPTCASAMTTDSPLSAAARTELHEIIAEISCALKRLRAADDAEMKPILERSGIIPEQFPRGDSATEAPHKEEPKATFLMQKAMEALLDKSATKILEIAGSSGLTLDQKMAEILRLDRRFEGKSSIEWSDLLGKTPDAVRQTSTWKTMRAAKPRLDD